MQTIRLRVNDKIYKQLMWFLGRFNNDEIQVITENTEFLSIEEYLHAELEQLEAGKAEFLSIDQLDDELETTIQKYEA